MPKAGHNVKYDVQVLRRAGVAVAGVVFDSMLASFVLDPSRRSHGIDALSLEFLGRTMTQYTDLTGKGRAQMPFAEVAVARAAAYCGADSATVLSLHEHFAPELERTALSPLLAEIEMPLIPVLVDMEWTGIAIDAATFAELGQELDSRSRRARARRSSRLPVARSSTSIRRDSSPSVLFEEHGLPVLKKTRTGPSTDAEVLEQLADMGHALPRLILGYRELQKLKSTYVDVLPLAVNRETGRIHTSFNQVGAQTGRLSSSDPNLQNIPVRTPRGEAIRRGFVPAPGWKFVVADYSQIELRLMAHLSGDPAFIEAFRQGDDIHRQTAAIIFGVPLDAGQQRNARPRQDDQLRRDLRPGSVRALEAARHFPGGGEAVHRATTSPALPACAPFSIGRSSWRRQQGMSRPCSGGGATSPRSATATSTSAPSASGTAQNTPLQGSAADLIKIAMVRIHRALPAAGLRARMVLQVHDELVIEAPADEAERAAAVVKRAHGGRGEARRCRWW